MGFVLQNLWCNIEYLSYNSPFLTSYWHDKKRKEGPKVPIHSSIFAKKRRLPHCTGFFEEAILVQSKNHAKTKRNTSQFEFESSIHHHLSPYHDFHPARMLLSSCPSSCRAWKTSVWFLTTSDATAAIASPSFLVSIQTRGVCVAVSFFLPACAQSSDKNCALTKFIAK